MIHVTMTYIVHAWFPISQMYHLKLLNVICHTQDYWMQGVIYDLVVHKTLELTTSRAIIYDLLAHKTPVKHTTKTTS